METTVTLSKQKLDLDQAASYLQMKIARLTEEHKILLAAIKAIDNEKENILEGKSILASEARKIMKEIYKSIES